MWAVLVWTSAVAFEYFDHFGDRVRPTERRNVQTVNPPLVRDNAAWNSRRLAGTADTAKRSSFGEMQSSEARTGDAVAKQASPGVEELNRLQASMKHKSDNAPITEVGADGPSDENIKTKKGEIQEKMTALDQIGTEFDTWQEGETKRIKKEIDDEVEKQTTKVKEHKDKAEKDIEEIATTTQGRIEESKTQAVAEMQKKGATMVQKVTTDISSYVQRAEADLQTKAANIRGSILDSKSEATQAETEAETLKTLGPIRFEADQTTKKEVNQAINQEVEEAVNFLKGEAQDNAERDNEVARQKRIAVTRELVEAIHRQRELETQHLVAVKNEAKNDFTQPMKELLLNLYKNLGAVGGEATQHNDEAGIERGLVGGEPAPAPPP